MGAAGAGLNRPDVCVFLIQKIFLMSSILCQLSSDRSILFSKSSKSLECNGIQILRTDFSEGSATKVGHNVQNPPKQTYPVNKAFFDSITRDGDMRISAGRVDVVKLLWWGSSPLYEAHLEREASHF